eukprot:SAG11_NODE_694_length_7695_cov_2.772775_4_plen_155_part_00
MWVKRYDPITSKRTMKSAYEQGVIASRNLRMGVLARLRQLVVAQSAIVVWGGLEEVEAERAAAAGRLYPSCWETLCSKAIDGVSELVPGGGAREPPSPMYVNPMLEAIHGGAADSSTSKPTPAGTNRKIVNPMARATLDSESDDEGESYDGEEW